MDNSEYIELLIAAYKDMTQKKEIERTREELLRVFEAEADAKRQKAQALIDSMVRLKTELARFKLSYDRLAKKTNQRVPAIEAYIRNTESKIRMISFKKNRRHK